MICHRNFGSGRQKELLAAAEGWKGNREASEEGTGEMPSCVGAEPGALGRLKRLTGLLIVNGS